MCQGSFLLFHICNCHPLGRRVFPAGTETPSVCRWKEEPGKRVSRHLADQPVSLTIFLYPNSRSPHLLLPPAHEVEIFSLIRSQKTDPMVVCQCRKATKLYCFVHKVAVCGECICFAEHQLCVVRTYSEWVIDGEYDWPPACSLCNASIEAGSESLTTRLGCLHLIHTNCLVSHIQSYPPQTAPAGYSCPACSSPIWPPKIIKDTGSRLHTKLKEVIIQSGLEKNIFGNHLVTLPPPESSVTPPSSSANREFTAEAYTHRSLLSEPDIVEIETPTSAGSPYVTDHDLLKSVSPAGPVATTRRGAYHVERQNSEISYHADDEDGTKKYSRRGPLRHKFLRLLLPSWSNSLPTLPVTAPSRKDGALDEIPEGRPRRQKSSRMDPRKILLTKAIMACMATMGILYYRLAQRSLGENIMDVERQ